MKKSFLFIILSVLSYSCSSSDDENNNQNSNYFNPPYWIIGTWQQEGSINSNGYIFRNDDFLLMSPVSGNFSFKEALSQTSSVGGNASTTEVISNTIYNVNITQLSNTYIYNFRKINDTKIEWVNDPMGDLVETFYIKQ
jgi:hypothetical protein